MVNELSKLEGHMGRDRSEGSQEKMLWMLAGFLLVSTVVCLIGWLTGIPPMATDWAVVAALFGAIATGGAAIVAVVSYRDSLKQRAEEHEDERFAMARRVSHAVQRGTSKPTPREYDAYARSLNALDASFGPTLTKKQKAGYKGPYDMSIRVDVLNATPYPVFDVVLMAPGARKGGATSTRAPEKVSLGTLLPGADDKLMFHFQDVTKFDAEKAPDRIALCFTDIWGQRWRTTQDGTIKLSVVPSPTISVTDTQERPSGKF